MRHGKKFNHLGRKSAHRKAMLSNMACSLIEHKRINTTLAKAKALRVYVEPLLTKSKEDSTHSRRTIFSYLGSKDAVTEVFREVAPKIADRPGGYTRIIKLGHRSGDAAEMAMIELVDFNDLYTTNKGASKAKAKRSRRGGKKATDTAAQTTAPEVTEKVEIATDTAETVEPTTTETKATAAEEPQENEPKTEDSGEDNPKSKE